MAAGQLCGRLHVVAIDLVLLVGGFFYQLYPLLYAVTPDSLFGAVFGIYELHSVGQAFAVTPLAFVGFGLWWVLTPALGKANAQMMRGCRDEHSSRRRQPLV